eukprot:scaffold10941_cov81-Phaeocystis_antarctica.AAC.3
MNPIDPERRSGILQAGQRSAVSEYHMARYRQKYEPTPAPKSEIDAPCVQRERVHATSPLSARATSGSSDSVGRRRVTRPAVTKASAREWNLGSWYDWLCGRGTVPTARPRADASAAWQASRAAFRRLRNSTCSSSTCETESASSETLRLIAASE